MARHLARLPKTERSVAEDKQAWDSAPRTSRKLFHQKSKITSAGQVGVVCSSKWTSCLAKAVTLYLSRTLLIVNTWKRKSHKFKNRQLAHVRLFFTNFSTPGMFEIRQNNMKDVLKSLFHDLRSSALLTYIQIGWSDQGGGSPACAFHCSAVDLPFQPAVFPVHMEARNGQTTPQGSWKREIVTCELQACP